MGWENWRWVPSLTWTVQRFKWNGHRRAIKELHGRKRQSMWNCNNPHFMYVSILNIITSHFKRQKITLLLYYYSTHARTNKCNLFVLYNKNFNGLRSCEIFSAQKTSPLMWSDVDLTSSVRVSSIRSVNNQCKCAQQSYYTHMAVTLGTSSLAIYLLMKMFLLIVNVSSLIALFAQDKFSF